MREDTIRKETEGAVVVLSVADIRPSWYNPRAFDDGSDETMDDLRESIRQHGVLQPVVVVPGEDGKYDIVMGERRWRAAVEAGWTEIPCIIRAQDSVDRLIVQQVIENTHRAELSIFDEARALRIAWVIENLRAAGRSDLVEQAMREAARREPDEGIPPEIWQKIAFGICLDELVWNVMDPPVVSMKEFLTRNGIAMKPDTMRKKVALLRLPPDVQVWAMRHQVKTPGIRAMLSLPPEIQRALQLMADREVEYRMTQRAMEGKEEQGKKEGSKIAQNLRTIRNSIVQHRRTLGVSVLIVLGVFPNTPLAQEWINVLKMEDRVAVGKKWVRIYDLSTALYTDQYPELRADDEKDEEDEGKHGQSERTSDEGGERNDREGERDEREESDGYHEAQGVQTDGKSVGGDDGTQEGHTQDVPRGIGGGLFGRIGERSGGEGNEPRGIGGGLFGRGGERSGGEGNEPRGIGGGLFGRIGERSGGEGNEPRGIGGGLFGRGGERSGGEGNEPRGIGGGLFGRGGGRDDDDDGDDDDRGSGHIVDIDDVTMEQVVRDMWDTYRQLARSERSIFLEELTDILRRWRNDGEEGEHTGPEEE
jgi:hypothetical protein